MGVRRSLSKEIDAGALFITPRSPTCSCGAPPAALRLAFHMIASFVGMLPGTWLYVYLGSLATTAAGLATAGSRGGSLRLALTVSGFVATLLVVCW